jgi:hypothetical protein
MAGSQIPSSCSHKIRNQWTVHVTLERVADQDDCVEKAICKFMIRYAGEGRGSLGWSIDLRAWALEDANGKTVQDYAMSCSLDKVWNKALKSSHQKAYRQMLAMAMDEASSAASFQLHAENYDLKNFRFDEWDEMCFVHSCISLGRLDVLLWYERTFYEKGNSPLFNGLGRHLWNTTRLDNKLIPRVFCAKSEQLSVGDCLEVLGHCRRPMQETNLDGTWVLHGWDLFSDQTRTVRIENGVCCTDIPSLKGATLRQCNSTNGHDGSMWLLLLANDDAEYWSSTQVSQSSEGAVGRICLKRSGKNALWVDNGREVVLTKVKMAWVM